MLTAFRNLESWALLTSTCRKVDVFSIYLSLFSFRSSVNFYPPFFTTFAFNNEYHVLIIQLVRRSGLIFFGKFYLCAVINTVLWGNWVSSVLYRSKSENRVFSENFKFIWQMHHFWKSSWRSVSGSRKSKNFQN